MGVERENGLTLNTRRYNTEEHRNHFILEDTNGGNVDFGEGKKNIVALEGTTVLVQNATELPFAVRHAEEVQMAVKQFGKAFTSAAFLTALKTAVCFTGRFFGVQILKTSFTSGIQQTTMLRFTLMLKTANIA